MDGGAAVRAIINSIRLHQLMDICIAPWRG
jgi:hypothetical protein